MVTCREALEVTHSVPRKEPQVKLQKSQGSQVVVAEGLLIDLSAAYPHYLILRTLRSHSFYQDCTEEHEVWRNKPSILADPGSGNAKH